MCGRFTQPYTWRELVALYGLTQPAMNLQPRYNIASTTTIDVLILRGGNRLELVPMLGPHSVVVEANRKGYSLQFQRAGRDNHRQADVS
jgi:putative SOS response-associated peptidase YedK